MLIRWNPGETIILRGLWRDQIWWALPVTVVRDDPALIALFWCAGTPNKIPNRRVTPLDLLSEHSLPLMDSHWVNTDVLMLIPPAAAHAIWAMWEAGQTRFLCWYVNLQSPMRRTPIGFDSIDYILDIVIQPDRREWQWKDEDEFQEALELGIYTVEEAQAIRTEGEAVIHNMQAGLSPFCDDWECWSPPEEWTIPDFSPGWDRIDFVK